MGSTYVKYVSEYSGKITFKLAYSGYTYSKRETVNGVEYLYCDQRSKCKASIIHRNGLWSQGRGKSWTSTGHASHPADIDRVERDLMRGKSNEVAKENPTSWLASMRYKDAAKIAIAKIQAPGGRTRMQRHSIQHNS
jgi:hypothetical protein